MESRNKPRVLIFIVAYFAELTILEVLERIPDLPDYEVEVLIIDDCSADATFDRAERLRRSGYRFPLTVLANAANQGYGGNQKLGYHYAIQNKFDYVALLHGDAQYAPEILPNLFEPLKAGVADAVLGSRMLRPRDALKGGMPLYKFAGNRILTWLQNRILRSRLSEFHTGYKAYTVDLLQQIPFDLNSNVFHFDTEIIIQFLRANARIVEVPIPTHYGDEVCRVPGLRYARDVMVASTVARMQDYGLVYRRNFDVRWRQDSNAYYEPKLNFRSTHSLAIAEVEPGTTVMDLGCGPGHLSPALRGRNCRVIGVDQYPCAESARFDEFYETDLNVAPFPRSLADVDTILLLDVIEHLTSPEKFCDEMRRRTQDNLQIRIVISTANIGYVVTRLMLLMGQFNYNRRGILDLTHTRLFTFSSLRRLLKEAGFVIEKEEAVPPPIPLVVRNRPLCRLLMGIQGILMKVSRRVFAYQMLMVVRPLPTLDTLLAQTARHSAAKSAAVSEIAVS
jgi:glycosyltransferase involved in cell wall biosynthesis